MIPFANFEEGPPDRLRVSRESLEKITRFNDAKFKRYLDDKALWHSEKYRLRAVRIKEGRNL